MLIDPCKVNLIFINTYLELSFYPILILNRLVLWFPPTGVLDWSNHRCSSSWSVPRVLLRPQCLSPEAGGLFDLQGHWNHWDGQHDWVVSVHSDSERHESQACQQTGEQLKACEEGRCFSQNWWWWAELRSLRSLDFISFET